MTPRIHSLFGRFFFFFFFSENKNIATSVARKDCGFEVNVKRGCLRAVNVLLIMDANLGKENLSQTYLLLSGSMDWKSVSDNCLCIVCL